MSISRSVSGDYACPRCQTVGQVECWLIVDTGERPDLAAQIAGGSFNRVSCAQCGTPSEVQVPLLVYRPGDQPVLVYSPVDGATEDVERRDFDELIGQLRQGLGDAWRDEWVAQGVAVLPRPSLALLLRTSAAGGPTVHVVAADRAADDLWQRYLASRAPQALDMAIDLWRQALALAGESPAGRARCQLALGRCLAERFDVAGDLADLDAAAEALQEARETGVLGSEQQPALLLTLGNVLSDRHERDPRNRHDLDAAIECYAEAVRLLEGHGPDALTAASNYAGSLKDRYRRDGRTGDLDEAIAVLQRALRVASAESPGLALPFDALAGALLTRFEATTDLTDLSAAITAYADAQSRVALDDPDRPAYLHNQALALARRHGIHGDDADARAATECFRMACQAGAKARPERLLDASVGWARWASRQRSWSDVIAASDTGLDALRSLDAANVLLSDRRSWQRQARGLVMMAAYAFARLGQVERAIVVLESHWARQLNERLERAGPEMDALHTLAPALHDQYRAAAAALRVLEAEEALASLQPSDAIAAPSLAHLRERFRAAVDALSRVAADIRQLPGFERFGSPAGFTTLVDVVDPGEALVYLVVTAVGSLALLVSRPGPDDEGPATSEAVWADDFTVEHLDRLLVDRAHASASGYLPAIFGQGDEEGYMLEGALQDVLPLLGSQLVAPLAARLRVLAPHQVTLISGGVLKLLPVTAASYLVDGRITCLLDEWTVTHVPSARALAHARLQLAHRDAAPPRLIGVANPLPLPEGLAPLEQASSEARTVAGHFPEGRATILDAEDATYDAVAAGAAAATHLHFACHGVFSGANPQLSLLVLSQGQPLLLYNVLYNVSMPAARLAVLSACDSAQIDYRSLPDEAVGLPAAFLQAGVPGVVGALWPVADESTPLLMGRFYQYHLRGDADGGDAPMPPAQALRRAQQWLRDETEFSSPLYWAPFVFYGA